MLTVCFHLLRGSYFMRREIRFLTYACLLIMIGVVAQIVGYAATGISIAGCRIAPAPDQFISFCGSPRFADYEHGAFWFGLEPEAIANLKAADVVFTGSSRTMFAFSTDEIRTYFAAHGLRQFNLGFSYEEQQTFFERLAVKYRLHPRILVIGVDPYFDDRVSQPAYAVLNDWHEGARTLLKKIEIKLQPMLCASCRPGVYTAFRSSRDGYFTWLDVLMPDHENSRAIENRLRDVQVNIPDTAAKATRFLQAIGMPASCVILVPMPTHQIWLKPDPIERVAQTLGAMYVDADTGDDLSLVDNIHLSYWSAKRFSAAFLREFDGLPKTCLTD